MSPFEVSLGDVEIRTYIDETMQWRICTAVALLFCASGFLKAKQRYITRGLG